VRSLGTEDKRRRLKEVATRLFREKGYAATSIRELARGVDLETASLYHYMERKDQLLFEISEESLREVFETVEPIARSSLEPLEKLRQMIQTHVSVVLEHPDKHAVMLAELRLLSPSNRDKIIDLRDRYEGLFESAITEAQDAGVMRNDFAPHLLKLALLNLLNWSIFWYRPDGPLDPQALGEFLTHMFLEGAGRVVS
jgi:AcrR family transcriptional regulator